MPDLIWFEWEKCPDGYTIEEFKPKYEGMQEAEPREDRNSTDVAPAWVHELFSSGERASEDLHDQDLLYDETQESYFVPQSDNVLRFSPIDGQGGAFMELADCVESLDGALAFVTKYGYPTKKPWGEHFKFYRLEAFQELADIMRGAIEAWREAKQKGDYRELVRDFNMEDPPFPDMTPSVPIQVQLRSHWAPSTIPQLAIIPNDLDAALCLQFAQAVTGDQQLRKCAACQTWYPFGSGTARRETATYCSDKCRKAAYYRQRKEKSQ